MEIQYFEETGLFALHTAHSTMLLQNADGYLGMAYYGVRLAAQDAAQLLRTDCHPFTPVQLPGEAVNFHNTFPHAYPAHGCGDFRGTALRVTQPDGTSACCPTYCGHRIYAGKPALPGLPHSHAGALQSSTEVCRTLELLLTDKPAGIAVTLRYTLFADSDVIAQSVELTNTGTAPVILERALSACLTLEGEHELITFNGAWARERHVQRVPVHAGIQSVGSICGASSHWHNPAAVLCAPETTETQGFALGMAFVYSGNFLLQCERNYHDSTRLLLGIHPEEFCWELTPGDSFCTPEVLTTCAAEGLGAMSRSFHDFIRNHVIRSHYWQHRERPVLVNNWEATYFGFDTGKLLAIADAAQECGLDMLVMDDGWFGRRNDDTTSLGDWFVNTEKLPEGLAFLGTALRERGLRFGIWFEPEMISPDSDLFRAHPDWAVQIPGRTRTLSRNQCVLDMTRPEIREYLFGRLCSIIREGSISYVKWDMNRQLTECASPTLPPHRQREFSHRYMLGVYELQERLLREFPGLLLENCTGGGGRFDCGMLCYSPQIWTSDDTDASERVKIQYGTSFVYPPSAMGAHVSVCPNHTVGRTSAFSARAHIALAGTFGYELDLTALTKDERAGVREQVALYRRFSGLTREGDFHRLCDPFRHPDFAAWMFVSKDRREALVTCFQTQGQPNRCRRSLRLAGLCPDAQYRLAGTEHVYSGSLLMQAGLPVPPMWGDAQSQLLHLVQLV